MILFPWLNSLRCSAATEWMNEWGVVHERTTDVPSLQYIFNMWTVSSDVSIQKQTDKQLEKDLYSVAPFWCCLKIKKKNNNSSRTFWTANPKKLTSESSDIVIKCMHVQCTCTVAFLCYLLLNIILLEMLRIPKERSNNYLSHFGKYARSY